MKNSLRLRLVALFVTILFVILSGVCLFLYHRFSQEQAEEFDRSLYNHGVDVARGINVSLFGNLSVGIDSLMGTGKVFPFIVGKSLVQLLRPDGSVIGRSREVSERGLPVPQLITDLRNHQTYDFQFYTDDKGVRYRQISIIVKNPVTPPFILQIAVPLTFLEKENQKLIKIFFITIPMALFLSMLGGIYFSGKALKPIKLIVAKAQSLDPSRLGERLPVSKVDDELRSLSLTLNDFLERTEKAFLSQERFIADASHQLKTPLAILRGELDVAMQKKRSEQETDELHGSISQELKRLSKIVENLLILARVDAGVASLSLKPVRLDELTIEVISRLKKMAQAKDIAIKMNFQNSAMNAGQLDFSVLGDEELLSTMISEIIENGIKYCPSGGKINIDLGFDREDQDLIFLKITDSGFGIKREDRQKIFERFYRGQNPVAPGNGLGLAISQKIVEAHGGTIQNQDSTFIIQINKN